MKPNSNDFGFDIQPVHLGLMVDKDNLNYFLCSHEKWRIIYSTRTALQYLIFKTGFDIVNI